ncbi:hypothetical protein MXL46_13865 [Heyndrickxia sporothermodurans]|uniref:Uncharacterized protein n=2 Tax=Heyndrickxia sporothermodurans TaxID=46224 RepID=A0AB37H9S1_9BACI|nr:hypothetical protein [Heyndrickxia sporothermodurans]MBL5768435.1 hypothetical protein [Heyndrickxia sporothermodurans]MBL5772085.1 hypothetical protein [Heyndrickxia sporothermodurans]MBL5779338.1 hypothetical protein [Heyndrickxia sporothermodurans]MBL5786327.1 hypothetical protein [Heyndrickxia sporothermodurans]MBL5790137.1 hypothetical protein [Heyndrickxia sporothermodurans]
MTRKKILEKKFKTYRIYPLHHMIFYSCLSVSTRDNFTDYLIKEFISNDLNLPTYSKPELIEHMVSNIENVPLYKLYSNQSSVRVNELREILTDQGLRWNGVRVPFQTHISLYTYDLITKLSKRTETIGEVIELAIEYYLISVSDDHYKIIKLAFKNNIKDNST